MKIFICNICGEIYIGPGIPPTCPFCGVENKYFRLGHVWQDANQGVEPTEHEKELLKQALELELSNVAFYDCVAKSRSTVEVAKMFKGLKKQELEHAEVFQKLLSLNELPEIKEQCVDDPKKVLEESLAREVRATNFYSKAVEESTTPRVQEVFEAIRKVEITHQELDKEVSSRY